MSNRTTKFVSAIFVGLLAGVSHTTLANGAVRAPNDCLSGPKGQTPPGGHWYYRIDRATKRHCWYLADEIDRPSRVTSQGSAPLTRPLSPRQKIVALSFADARAELPTPQTRFEAPNRNDAWIPLKSAETAENSQIAPMRDTNTQQSVVASRWPEQFGATAAINPTSTKAEPANSDEPSSRPLPPPAPREAGPSATAKPPSQPPTYSAQLQLAALLGGLALAGIAGGAMFNFGSSRGDRPRKAQARPGTIWEPTDDDRIRLSAQPRAYHHTHRSNFARDLDRARRNDRITEFYSQLSKHAAT